MVRLSPIVQFVRGLGEYYLVSEVAAAIDVPEGTIRRRMLSDPERWGPSETAMYGAQRIHLFTPADLERLATLFERIRAEHPAMLSGSPGRPRMWSRAETVDRQRRRAKVCYYRRRARQLRGEDPQAARAANNKATVLARELAKEGAERRRQLATRM